MHAVVVFAGADEVPGDGIDQACDGVDAAACFVDAADDGFGDGPDDERESPQEYETIQLAIDDAADVVIRGHVGGADLEEVTEFFAEDVLIADNPGAIAAGGLGIVGPVPGGLDLSGVVLDGNSAWDGGGLPPGPGPARRGRPRRPGLHGHRQHRRRGRRRGGHGDGERRGRRRLAGAHGGGLWAAQGSYDTTVDDTHFGGNVAGLHGVGARVGDATFTDCTFGANQAEAGGGIFGEGVTVVDGSFTANDALGLMPGSPVHPNRYHLTATSACVDAGPPGTVDPDGGPADIGAYGGPDADLWDVDGDGFFAWWQPGPYDPAVHLPAGLDCNDLSAGTYPGAPPLGISGFDTDCDGI